MEVIYEEEQNALLLQIMLNSVGVFCVVAYACFT